MSPWNNIEFCLQKNKQSMNNAVTNGLDDETCCRICLDAEPARDLISPCSCMGSTKYVHQGCLLEYAKKNNKIAYNLSSETYELKCEICNFVMTVSGETVYIRNDCSAILRVFRQNLFSILLSFVILLLSIGAVGYLANKISSKNFYSFNSFQYAIFGLILLSGIICLILLFLILKQLLVTEIMVFQIKDKKLQQEESGSGIGFTRQVGNYILQ